MKTYLLARDVTDAHGTQTYKVEAESTQHAWELFTNGGGEFVDEEIEVTSLSEVEISDIYEI